MIFIFRTIEHFRASAEAVNHSVKKSIVKANADSFLFTAEHTEMLLRVILLFNKTAY